MCSGTGRVSTDAPTALGEPEGYRGHKRKKPGLWSVQPPFMVFNPGRGPTPWPATPSHPGKSKNCRTRGCSHGLFASLGKSRTQGLSHIKSRRAARALQRRLAARGLSDWREGVHTAARGHFREDLSSHHQGAELRWAWALEAAPAPPMLRWGQSGPSHQVGGLVVPQLAQESL